MTVPDTVYSKYSKQQLEIFYLNERTGCVICRADMLAVADRRGTLMSAGLRQDVIVPVQLKLADS